MISLIVGLGNPGDQYLKTRHNAGFWLLDLLAKNYQGIWKTEKKFFAETAQISINHLPIRLLKPQTFMNASGRSVASIAHFYNIDPESILVVHDELDLPEGDIKLKKGGGHGGHNGLRDIISALGTREFYRLRIGIDRPQDRKLVIDYVLKSPSKSGMIKIDLGNERGIKAIEMLIKDNAEKAMHWLHTK